MKFYTNDGFVEERCLICLMHLYKVKVWQVNARSEQQREQRVPDAQVVRERTLCLFCPRDYDEDEE